MRKNKQNLQGVPNILRGTPAAQANVKNRGLSRKRLVIISEKKYPFTRRFAVDVHLRPRNEIFYGEITCLEDIPNGFYVETRNLVERLLEIDAVNSILVDLQCFAVAIGEAYLWRDAEKQIIEAVASCIYHCRERDIYITRNKGSVDLPIWVAID